MNAPTTHRQEIALQFIVDYMGANGYPPSVREIGVELGHRSPASTQFVLNELRRKGLLERDSAGSPRAIRVVMDGCPYCGKP